MRRLVQLERRSGALQAASPLRDLYDKHAAEVNGHSVPQLAAGGLAALLSECGAGVEQQLWGLSIMQRLVQLWALAEQQAGLDAEAAAALAAGTVAAAAASVLPLMEQLRAAGAAAAQSADLAARMAAEAAAGAAAVGARVVAGAAAQAVAPATNGAALAAGGGVAEAAGSPGDGPAAAAGEAPPAESPRAAERLQLLITELEVGPALTQQQHGCHASTCMPLPAIRCSWSRRCPLQACQDFPTFMTGPSLPPPHPPPCCRPARAS
jgi:hypothetical protein